MCYLRCQKIIEGSIFWGRDLKSDLKARLRLFEAAVLDPTSKGCGGERSELTAGGLTSSRRRRRIASALIKYWRDQISTVVRCLASSFIQSKESCIEFLNWWWKWHYWWCSRDDASSLSTNWKTPKVIFGLFKEAPLFCTLFEIFIFCPKIQL